MCHHEKNLYVHVCKTVLINKITCAVIKKLQNFLLCKFRQCEDYSEQSKPYFEPLTFAWQRCLLPHEHFDRCMAYPMAYPVAYSMAYCWSNLKKKRRALPQIIER